MGVAASPATDDPRVGVVDAAMAGALAVATRVTRGAAGGVAGRLYFRY